MLNYIEAIATVIGSFVGAIFTFWQINKAIQERKAKEFELWKKEIEDKISKILSNCQLREGKTDTNLKSLENRMVDHLQLIRDFKADVSPITQIAQQVAVIFSDVSHIKEMQEEKYNTLEKRADGQDKRIDSIEDRINKD